MEVSTPTQYKTAKFQQIKHIPKKVSMFAVDLLNDSMILLSH